MGTHGGRGSRTTVAGVLLLLAMLALAACGGTGGTAVSPSVTPSGSASGPSQQRELAWTFKTGAAIHSSAAVSHGVVYVGSDDGYLYAVK